MRPPVAAVPLPAVTLLLLPATASAMSWGCTTLQNGVKYDFNALKGKHEVVQTVETAPTIRNTTWQIDPCGPLQKTKEKKADEQCQAGTYVCGLLYHIESDGKSHLDEVIAVAGDIDGHNLDEKVTLFNHTTDGAVTSNGVRVEFNGGNKYAGHDQRAVIDFVCDMEKTGLERRDDGDNKKDDESKPEPPLRFVSYEWSEADKKKTLQLEWRTKYACEEYAKGDGDKGKDKDKEKDGGTDKGSSSHWGFFTWVFILVFLGIAAYLIFGSWMSYNRYGARGWDLVPHGDAIREVPYLLKDFARRVGSTLQGRSTRGGYSAV